MGTLYSTEEEPPSDAEDPDQPTNESVRSHLILDRSGNINDHYEIEQTELGSGACGSVAKGKNRLTGFVRAIKTISKKQMKDVPKFKKEIALMKSLDHPHIIKLFETFEDHAYVYLVMELCTGGELFDRIIEAGMFSEVQAAILMQQVIRAIFYMHENHVCHRDIKPENFIFLNKEPIEESSLKIIDFGLSSRFEPGKDLETKAGTPYYVAPEVLAGKYNHMSDVWSCGVLMYILLCGYPPFNGDTDREIFLNVRKAPVDFPAEDWKHVSQSAKELVNAMLNRDVDQRYTAEQILNHEWIKDHAPQSIATEFQSSFLVNIRNFGSIDKFKKMALSVIASRLPEEQIKALKDTFISLDANGDGLLTMNELRDGMTKANLDSNIPEIEELFNTIDSDGSGVIDYTEFLAATLDKRAYVQESICWAAFRVFDTDGDGKISREELEKVLQDDGVGQVVEKQSIDTLLKEFDSNSDGGIDFNEFMSIMRK